MWSENGEHVRWYESDPEAEPQWRLATGRIEGDELRRDGFVGEIGDYYIYPYFGIDAGPCAPAG